MSLPEAFLQNLRAQLGEAEFRLYLEAMTQPHARGLRLNPLRALSADWRSVGPDGLEEPIPWVADAWHLAPDSRAGAHPLHEGGAYYLQEPSAMAAVAALDVRPGQRVLDLCAAPGGKSTQIAGLLAGEGLLVANEPVPTRAQVLSRNVERLGVRNAAVLCALPDALQARFPAFFDRVLVDAPCSGEGMFRRQIEAGAEWTPDSPARCAARQLDILRCAARMLRPGGLMVYSTCTFNAVENEGVLERFLSEHSDFMPDAFALPGLEPAPTGVLRLFPQRVRGEGHFVSRLRRATDAPVPAKGGRPSRPRKSAALPPWREPLAQCLAQARSPQADAQALLAVKTKKVTLGNVCVEGADMSLPLVRTKNEGYYEYGDMTVTIGEKKITTPEELLAIGESPAALKKKYIMEADIDLSGAAAGGFAVPGTFSGELDGNGFTLSGLNAVLFEKLDGAQVSDLVIEGTTLTSNAQKGALANEIKNSVIENVQVRNLTIKNNTNQVGGLAGLISGSTVKRISAENISIKASDTIGGIAGQFDGTILSDCVVTGEIEGTIRHPMGTRIGGMTGWLGNGIIRNCIAKIEITAPDRTGNGGLIGGPQNGNVTVESSVSLSTGANANRISGWNVLGTASSAYELDSSDSQSNINETNADRIFPVSQQQAAEKAFYLETLGWSEEVWDFDGLAAGGLPELRR